MSKLYKMSDLTGNNSLLDSELNSILITIDDGINIELTFSNFREKSLMKQLKLCFIDVQNFQFSGSVEYLPYCVSEYKFFIDKNNLYYISLDPDESSQTILDSDMDYIFSNDIEIKVFEK